MKLQQLRYIYEVARHKLNVSQTAEALFTSQPGISKQIRLLEDELGVQIFSRNGKHLAHITPAGARILEVATEILQLSKKIQDIASDFVCEDRGVLRIASTHTFSQYLLPSLVQRFTAKYPAVRLELHQGINGPMDTMLDHGDIDLVLFEEQDNVLSDKVIAPCFLWHHVLVVPKEHPLAAIQEITLDDMTQYPLMARVMSDGHKTIIEKTFKEHGVELELSIAATDSEILKSYVRMGLGIAIVARMAIKQEDLNDLAVIKIDHLFKPAMARIVFHRNFFFRKYVLDFVYMLAPHLDLPLLERLIKCRTEKDVFTLIPEESLPHR